MSDLKGKEYILVVSPPDQSQVFNLVSFKLDQGEKEIEEIFGSSDQISSLLRLVLIMSRINRLTDGMGKFESPVKPIALHRVLDGVSMRRLADGSIFVQAEMREICRFDEKGQPIYLNAGQLQSHSS